MELVEIRESGLLELYVAGELSGREMSRVEEHLDKFPELREDLIAIGNTLESYARLHEVSVSDSFKKGVLDSLSAGETPVKSIAPVPERKRSMWIPAAASVLLVVSALSIYQLSKVNDRLAALQSEKELYEENQSKLIAQKEAEIAKFKALHTAESKVLTLAATDKFNTAQVVMYLDESSKKNYIELKDMPNITGEQSYQLWSLKADVAPIPLTVFQGDENIFEVAYEAGTGTYAITIEPFGGQDTPSLDNLVGTIGV